MRRAAVVAAASICGLASLAAAQSSADGDGMATPVVEHTIRRIAAIEEPLDFAVAPSPDGRHYIALQTRPSWIIWVLPVEGEPFAFREEWSAYGPRWAASGNRIGFLSGGGAPRVWTVEVDPANGLATDPPRMLIRTLTTAYTFSPDGEQIALVEARSTAAGASELHIVRYRSRKSRRLLHEDGMIYWLDWSPDGDFIYYGLARDSDAEGALNSVRRLRARGGSPESLFEVGEYLGLSPDGSLILYRPADGNDGDAMVVEIASLDGASIQRFRLPPGPAPRWGADSETLVLVRPSADGTELLEVRFPPD